MREERECVLGRAKNYGGDIKVRQEHSNTCYVGTAIGFLKWMRICKFGTKHRGFQY